MRAKKYDGRLADSEPRQKGGWYMIAPVLASVVSSVLSYHMCASCPLLSYVCFLQQAKQQSLLSSRALCAAERVPRAKAATFQRGLILEAPLQCAQCVKRMCRLLYCNPCT